MYRPDYLIFVKMQALYLFNDVDRNTASSFITGKQNGYDVM